jgi:hypothetical protein
MFNLSLPNNRNDLLKEALTYLSDATGNLAITPESISYALSNSDMVATWPVDTKEGWWRYRLKGSTLLGHAADETSLFRATRYPCLGERGWPDPDGITPECEITGTDRHPAVDAF